jgi:glycine/D-amino acid oxidase-like deaminating enzyme
MSNEGKKVRVIGAGIIGGALASCLHRDRDEILIADPNEPEHGASFGNAGVFGTSSVVPMSMPGIIRQLPAWPRDPDRRAGRAAPAKLRPSPLSTRTLVSSKRARVCGFARENARTLGLLCEQTFMLYSYIVLVSFAVGKPHEAC